MTSGKTVLAQILGGLHLEQFQRCVRRYSPEARKVLDELLEKYAEHGDAQFVLPDVLKVPPLSRHGEIGDIVKLFGSAEQLREAVTELQNSLYAS